jgi:hypothetical protein
MAKQTFTTGQVLTAAQMTSLQQTAMDGGAASAKTASYTLVAADAGTAISMSNASATTITVNTGLFAAGDTVYIQNLGAGACVITAGTATVSTAASLSLAQYEGGTLDFTSASSAVFFKAAGSSSGGLTLISETVASGLSSLSLSSIPSTFKQLFLEWDGIFHSNNSTTFDLRINNVSTESYWGNLVTGSDSTLTQAAMASTVASPIPAFGKAVNLNPTAEFYFNNRGSLFIDNYASSTKTKKYKLGIQYYDNSATAKYRTQIIQDSYFNSTSAITSIDIVRTSGTGTFSNITNSTIRLYGLA